MCHHWRCDREKKHRQLSGNLLGPSIEHVNGGKKALVEHESNPEFVDGPVSSGFRNSESSLSPPSWPVWASMIRVENKVPRKPSVIPTFAVDKEPSLSFTQVQPWCACITAASTGTGNQEPPARNFGNECRWLRSARLAAPRLIHGVNCEKWIHNPARV